MQILADGALCRFQGLVRVIRMIHGRLTAEMTFMKQAVYVSNMIKHTDGPCILCTCNTLGGIGSPFQQCGLMLSRVGRNVRA